MWRRTLSVSFHLQFLWSNVWCLWHFTYFVWPFPSQSLWTTWPVHERGYRSEFKSGLGSLWTESPAQPERTLWIWTTGLYHFPTANIDTEVGSLFFYCVLILMMSGKTSSSNNSVIQAQKLVDQLRMEASMERFKVCKDLYIRSNIASL